MVADMLFYVERPTDGLRAADLPRNKKLVHLVRHGQGYHNVEAMKQTTPCQCRQGISCLFNRPEFIDAHLTPVGENEARAVDEMKLSPELVVVSPLFRTLQTATLAFPPAKAPMVAREEVREVVGLHACDRRGTIGEVRPQFPHVEFGEHLDDADVEFDVHVEGGEPDEVVWLRGKRALKWIGEREEKEVAIVSHSGFLRRFITGSVVCEDPKLQKPWRTAECRTVVISFP